MHKKSQKAINRRLKSKKRVLKVQPICTETKLIEVVLALITALEFREPMTVGHSERVTQLALSLGKKIGLNPLKMNLLKLAGLLHDIGKIGVDQNILNKPGLLTPEEFNEIKKHPVIAKSILNPIKGLENITPIILHHHEKFNGEGYPDGLIGEKIPLEARIINIVDTYDAVISNRPYRNKLPKETAVQILISEKGRQMDPRLVDVFLKLIENQRE